jgi:hypothetical protein
MMNVPVNPGKRRMASTRRWAALARQRYGALADIRFTFRFRRRVVRALAAA